MVRKNQVGMGAMKKIIIDCDPGQDDAIALLLALAAEDELDLLGVTTVAGNVTLDLTQRNARLMCDLAGRKQTRVFAGCARPLAVDLITATRVHGKTGIDGYPIGAPETPLQQQHAVDFINDSLREARAGARVGGRPGEGSGKEEGKVTLVAMGPLTNLGMAIVKQPDNVSAIESIVLMGGALREGGNVTPSAEFNIRVDPHAADVVFSCGRPIVAMGLDVTHQVLCSPKRVDRIRALSNPAAIATADMLDFFNRHDRKKYGFEGAPLHDPCTLAYLLQPDMFDGKACNIAVETRSELTLGHTAVDFWDVTGRPKNAHWVYGVDSNAFFDLLVEQLARYSVGY